MKRFAVLVVAMIVTFGFIPNAQATTSMLIAAIGNATDYTSVPVMLTVDDVDSLENMMSYADVVLDWCDTSIAIHPQHSFGNNADEVALVASTPDSVILKAFAEVLKHSIVNDRQEVRREAYVWHELPPPGLGAMRTVPYGIVTISMAGASELAGNAKMMRWLTAHGFHVRGVATRFKVFPEWVMKSAPFRVTTVPGGPANMYRAILAAGKPPVEVWYRFWVAPNSPANQNPSGYIHVVDANGTAHLTAFVLKGLTINDGTNLIDTVMATGWSHVSTDFGPVAKGRDLPSYAFAEFEGSGGADDVFAALRSRGVIVGAPVEKPNWIE